MKNKVKLITFSMMERWIYPANMLVNSLCPTQMAIKQFNGLSPKQRNDIIIAYKKYDEIRRKKIPKKDVNDDVYITCVMVDSHIIATEFDIDPLTAIMCLGAPCKSNESIFVK